jgi:hypothetical protein
MIVKNQVKLKKLNGLKHMTSKIWIEKSREIIDDIPNDILVKLAYFKFDALLSLCMMVSIEAQLHAEGKDLKNLKI